MDEIANRFTISLIIILLPLPYAPYGRIFSMLFLSTYLLFLPPLEQRSPKVKRINGVPFSSYDPKSVIFLHMTVLEQYCKISMFCSISIMRFLAFHFTLSKSRFLVADPIDRCTNQKRPRQNLKLLVSLL